MRRSDWGKDFHTYTLQGTEDFMGVFSSSKTRLHPIFSILRSELNRYVTDVFTSTLACTTWLLSVSTNLFSNAVNSLPSYQMCRRYRLKQPVEGQENAAPFDQDFYLIMNVAVGGTNGRFRDGRGSKPWLDGSPNASRSFLVT
ncbi:hypothetical protein BD410DRAFT_791481 [Rickenella mellea]|uniref:Uncharacterized protein n=1 Tax=Rickenella mellea TaxID=50990 RepID=A0A4Y7PY74_9AGAM|nr:hypothetical protein BD410DRAFT_791481 [Rickenella mellea]